MKIVFSNSDLKDMVRAYLEETTQFEVENLDVAIVGDQLVIGIDEEVSLDVVAAPVQVQAATTQEEKPKKQRRPRKPKDPVVVVEAEEEAPIELTTAAEEVVEEAAEEITTAVDEAVAELDEQLVTANEADELFGTTPADEPTKQEEEIFDPSKPLFG